MVSFGRVFYIRPVEVECYVQSCATACPAVHEILEGNQPRLLNAAERNKIIYVVMSCRFDSCSLTVLYIIIFLLFDSTL